MTAIASYLSRSDWRVKENANVGFSLGGLVLHTVGDAMARHWLDEVYPESVARAHREGDFHIHDLGMLCGYCAGWSLGQLVEQGLGGVPGKTSSGPARHLSTLVNQIVNFLGVLQNEWAGAQALSSFDTYLAPFVKADSLSYEEVRQCLQSFVFGVNTPSRWGSQAPFTNVSFDGVCPPDLCDRPAIVGGRSLGFTYGECQREMDLVNRAFLEIMAEGDAEGRGFAYPIPTYNLTADFPWDSPNARLLFSMAAKYGTPYFQNFIRSDLRPEDVRSMCCRLRLDRRELRKRGGGLFGSDEMTGSIGVVTINLPALAYQARRDGEREPGLFERLDALMDLAALSLALKRQFLGQLLDEGLFPYTRRYLGGFDRHFSTIGLVGMHEACLNFLGPDQGIDTPAGAGLAERVLEHMSERLEKYQAEQGVLFNLEATPAESTSHRLALCDVRRFPGVIVSGAENPFYTNSTQLPVDGVRDIFDALDHQEPLQVRYTGGTVFHAFFGEKVSDWTVCRNLVRTIAERYRVPYFTISPTYSVCPAHGYLPGEQVSCPRCQAETEVYARIVGYYRPLNQWNAGKHDEFGLRALFGEPAEALPAAGPAASYLLFTQSGCPRCPAMRAKADTLGMAGEVLDVATDRGFAAATRWSVSVTPTLILLDGDGREKDRILDAADWSRVAALSCAPEI